MICVSVDPVADDIAWHDDIKDISGNTVNFPIVSDEDCKVCKLYNMLMETKDPVKDLSQLSTVRTVFIIGPDKRLKLTMTYPPSCGRNFDEVLRVVDSLQLTENKQVATPVNWRESEPVVILPTVSKEEADRKYPQGYKVIKPYLRYLDLEDSVESDPEKKKAVMI